MTSSAPSPSPNRPRVLLVDDDELQRCIVEAWLERRVDVVAVTSAAEAIAELERAAVAVVLTDDDLETGLRGRELLAVVRERWPNVRRLLMSGSSVVTDEANRAWQLFLPKPVDWAALETALALIRRRSRFSPRRRRRPRAHRPRPHRCRPRWSIRRPRRRHPLRRAP